MKKLRKIRPQIDSRRPNSYKHLRSKKKKEQLLEDRFTEIERENRILLEKMTHIMQKQNRTSTSFNAINKAVPTYGIKLGPNKSLNKNRRKKELMRITLEN